MSADAPQGPPLRGHIPPKIDIRPTGFNMTGLRCPGVFFYSGPGLRLAEYMNRRHKPGNGLRVKTEGGQKLPKFWRKLLIRKQSSAKFRRYPQILYNPMKVISSIFRDIFRNIFRKHFFLPRSFRSFIPPGFLPSGSFRQAANHRRATAHSAQHLKTDPTWPL